MVAFFLSYPLYQIFKGGTDMKMLAVKTNMGTIPLEDYLDITASQHGYSDYEDMRAHGLYLDIPATLTVKEENKCL